MNNDKKTLLSKNRLALTALYRMFGFDLAKPYGVKELTGSFTLNELYKAANADGITKESGNFALFVFDEGYCFFKALYALQICGGTIDIHRRPCNYGIYSRNKNEAHLTEFYAKKDFERIRKSGTARAWLCYQLRGYAHETHETRYTKPADPARFDKSGYDVASKRADLKQRAAALRAERLQADYLSHDNSEKITELSTMLGRAKISIANKLLTANDSEGVAVIEKTLSSWADGLRWAWYDYEILRDRHNQKKFASQDAFMNKYTSIKNRLEALI